MPQQQQTVLRVSYNNTTGVTEHFVLDTFSDIPIKITRSFAELQDISKKNSDTALNVKLPGSKRNNRFFENFFDVDVESFKFSPLKKVNCEVLINDEAYFKGYLRLDSISVENTQVEYEVSLYSIVANLFADIGNKLLKDLNFSDSEYTFNHTFNQGTVTDSFYKSNFGIDGEQPEPFFYPIVHNGYLYSGSFVNFTGGTVDERTNLYTSSPILDGAYPTKQDALDDGVKPFRINTPEQGLYDNQLKPALSIWNIVKLIFKEAGVGYTINSDFFNTPWMKSLYMYGYFSSNRVKFSYQLTEIPTYPIENCAIIFQEDNPPTTFNAIVVQKGTGVPCFCSEAIDFVYQVKRRHTVLGVLQFNQYYLTGATIGALTSGVTINLPQGAPQTGDTVNGITFPGLTIYRYYNGWNSADVDIMDLSELRYEPVALNEHVTFFDGDYVNFSKVIDPQHKQIDFLSSLAKKFNLVFIPDPDIPNRIIIEPYTYFIGTGNIYDWTDKLSYDEGFTVEPALNNIDSYLIYTDSEDGDYGNKLFKDQNNRTYGQKFITNNTDFKSTTGETTTIFGPQVFRQWDTVDQEPNGNIDFPLGINYAGSTNTENTSANEQLVHYQYSGLKSKIKLFWWLQGNNVLNEYAISGKTYNFTYSATTYTAYVADSDGLNEQPLENIPIVSNAMPIGMDDRYKINNDSLSLLFNAEQLVFIDVFTYNTYTYNDCYGKFYEKRINNLYNPNTRYLKGKFYLKLSDYKNLNANDIIKIKNQYFTWNKIDNFNVTDTELTSVELIQININPDVYPTRYFKYFYCDNPDLCYKIAIDFTNSNLLYTNFGWSVLYDHNCGIVYGQNQPTGYTSTFMVVSGATDYYIPYFIEEISQDDYDNGFCLEYTCDKLLMHIYNTVDGPFYLNMPTYYVNSGQTISGLNLFKDCDTFDTIATREGIRLGTSTMYGNTDCQVPNALATELDENINTEINEIIQIES